MDNMDHKTSLQENVAVGQTISVTILKLSETEKL